MASVITASLTECHSELSTISNSTVCPFISSCNLPGPVLLGVVLSFLFLFLFFFNQKPFITSMPHHQKRVSVLL